MVNVYNICFLYLCYTPYGVIIFENKLLLLSLSWFILRPRLPLYSAGSAVNMVQVVLPRFSVSLFCFVQAKTLCRFMYFLAALVLVCVDVMVMLSAYAMT